MATGEAVVAPCSSTHWGAFMKIAWQSRSASSACKASSYSRSCGVVTVPDRCWTFRKRVKTSYKRVRAFWKRVMPGCTGVKLTSLRLGIVPVSILYEFGHLPKTPRIGSRKLSLQTVFRRAHMCGTEGKRSEM